VTGKKARYQDIPLQVALEKLPSGKIGAKASPGFNDPTLKTAAEHFGRGGVFLGIVGEILDVGNGIMRCWMRFCQIESGPRRSGCGR